jgi:hypothetical protein
MPYALSLLGMVVRGVFQAPGPVQMYLLTGEPDTCTDILYVEQEEASPEETPGMDRDVRQFQRPGFAPHCLVDCVGLCG